MFENLLGIVGIVLKAAGVVLGFVALILAAAYIQETWFPRGDEFDDDHPTGGIK